MYRPPDFEAAFTTDGTIQDHSPWARTDLPGSGDEERGPGSSTSTRLDLPSMVRKVRYVLRGKAPPASPRTRSSESVIVRELCGVSGVLFQPAGPIETQGSGRTSATRSSAAPPVLRTSSVMGAGSAPSGEGAKRTDSTRRPARRKTGGVVVGTASLDFRAVTRRETGACG